MSKPFQRIRPPHRRGRHCVLSVAIASAMLGALPACSSNKADTAPRHIVEVNAKPELRILNKAMESYDRGLYDISRTAWTELRDSYPSSYYLILAELKIADSLFFSKLYPEAIVAYEEFIQLRRGHPALPYARYQIGNAHWRQYQDELHDQGPLLLAIERFKSLIQQHPEHEYAHRARERIQQAQNEFAKHEAAVAQFYLAQGEHQAALSRLMTLMKRFPQSDAVESTLSEFESYFREEKDELPPSIVAQFEELHTRAFTSQTPSPDAPLLLAKQRELIQTRLPKVATETDSSKPSSRANEKQTSSTGSEVIPARVTLDCEILGETPVFAVALNKAFEVTSEGAEKGDIFEATITPKDSSGSPVVLPKTGSCALGSVQAVVNKPSGSDAITFRATGVASKRLTLLRLDRPHRLVFLVSERKND